LAEVPDGDFLKTSWWLYREVSEYNGIETELSVAEIDALTASFIIPKDAVTGDYFNIIFEVKDDASAPMTRYAQIIVTVK
ncbi:MAG: hypothetical protein RR224_09555, partial [Clostridia bacterium]